MSRGQLPPRRLRILNVIRFPIGGIRSYLRYTYTRLPPELYETTIVTVDRPEAALLPSGMQPMAVELRTVPESQAFGRLLLETRRLLRSGGFDLIHSQGTTAAIVSDLSAARFGVPHIVTLHETFRDEQFSGALGKVKRSIVGRALRRADAVIAVSDDARNNLIAHVPLRTRSDSVAVIRNGVPVESLLREATETKLGIRQRWNLGDDVVLLGYIGRFMPEKGFDVLLEAVRLLSQDTGGVPPFRIVAVNDGAFLREYREQIVAAGIEEFFIFTGFQPSAAGVLSELDAVVVPSRREACPLVVMEALVLGCPLVASDCIGVRELTAGTPALKTAAGDAQSLVDGLREIMRNRSRARDSAQAFTSVARDVFDASHAAAGLAAIFQRVVFQP